MFYKHHKSEIGVTEKFEAISGSSVPPPHVKVGPIPRHLASLDMRTEGGEVEMYLGKRPPPQTHNHCHLTATKKLGSVCGKEGFFDQKFQFGGNF